MQDATDCRGSSKGPRQSERVNPGALFDGSVTPRAACVERASRIGSVGINCFDTAEAYGMGTNQVSILNRIR